MELNTLWTQGHTQSILCVDANKDGHVASGGDCGEICLWSPDGKIVSKRTFQSESCVNSMCFSPAQPSLLYISVGEVVQLFDIRCPMDSSMARFAYNKDDINQLAIDPKDTFLAACDDDGVVKIIDVQNRKVFKTLKGHDNICSSVAFHPQVPREMATGGFDCLVNTWDISKGRPLVSLNMQEMISAEESADEAASPYTINPPFIHSVKFSRDGGLLVCGLENGQVQLLDRKGRRNLQPRQALVGHSLGVTQVCFLPEAPGQSKDLLLSAGNDCKLLVWDLNVNPEQKHSQDITAEKPSESTGGGQTSNNPDVILEAETVDSRTDKLSDSSHDDCTPDSPSKRSPIISLEHKEKINWVRPVQSSGGKSMVFVADVSKNLSVYQW
ncbi:WD repeat-containing protein 53-like [Asterias rubens]|uniref:WD repeat-containing protein 53-like n=1 Tax=Asterias rubens TaxID=7604 RepID=UPI001455AF95|nr:WD repeat-containing protein 53-like [Asterias rubens]